MARSGQAAADGYPVPRRERCHVSDGAACILIQVESGEDSLAALLPEAGRTACTLIQVESGFDSLGAHRPAAGCTACSLIQVESGTDSPRAPKHVGASACAACHRGCAMPWAEHPRSASHSSGMPRRCEGGSGYKNKRAIGQPGMRPRRVVCGIGGLRRAGCFGGGSFSALRFPDPGVCGVGNAGLLGELVEGMRYLLPAPLCWTALPVPV